MVDAELVRIKPQELEKVLAKVKRDVNYYIDIYFYREIGEDSFWLGTDWHVIHYILTGEVCWIGKSLLLPPLCNIILGGRIINSEDDETRYLTPNEVRDVANFLKEHPVSWVEKEFYKVKDQPVEIYKMFMEGDELRCLSKTYELFCSMYFDAAEAGDAMIIYIG
jgi:hypothetical protein